MLAVLNGFQNIKAHDFFLGKSQRWSFRGGPPWGFDFLRGLGISKTIKSLTPPLKVGHINSVHFPQSKETWQTRATTSPKDTKKIGTLTKYFV